MKRITQIVGLVWLAAVATHGFGAQEAIEKYFPPTANDKIYAEADAHHRRGDLEKALQVYLDGLENESHSPAEEIFLRGSAASCLSSLGRHAEALDQVILAEPLLSKSFREKQQRAELAGHRASIYSHWGLIDLAWRWSDLELRELDRAEKAGDEVGWSRFQALLQRVKLELGRGHYETAERLAIEALRMEIAIRLPSLEGHLPGYRATMQLMLGVALWEQEKRDPSFEGRSSVVVEQAVANPALIGRHRVQAEILRAEMAVEDGDWDTAQIWLDAAERSLDSMPPSERPPQRRSWAAISVRQAIEAGSSTQELDLWREQMEELHLEFLEYWENTPTREGGYGILRKKVATDFYSEFIRLVLSLEGESGPEVALERLIEIQELSRLSQRWANGITTLRRLRKEFLQEDHAVLVYLPATARTHLFVVDKNDAAHYALPGHRYVRELRADLRSSLGSRCEDEESRLSQASIRTEISQLLFPKDAVPTLARARRWSIVGLEDFGHIPFECLPFGDHEFLGAAVAIDVLPSLPFGLFAAIRSKETLGNEANDVWLMVADTNPLGSTESATGSRSIPAVLSRSFASPILESYPASQRRGFFGAEASRETLGRPDFENCRVLQFLTHGIHDPWREQPTGLQLSAGEGQNGSLFAEDIQSIKAPPLVILTACQSAVSPNRSGDAAAATLSGAFLAAGACAVIDSGFDLEPESTRRMSASIHRSLGEGRSPAEALRDARADLLQDPRFADPYYHSLLRVFGVGQQPVFERPIRIEEPVASGPSNGWGAFAVCGVLLGVLLGFWARGRAVS